MDEETKRYFDALETLRVEAVSEFDKKVSFEWKITFSLWAALAAILAFFAQAKDIISSLKEYKNLVILLGLIIIGIYALFLIWIQCTHTINRKRQRFWNGEMMKLCNYNPTMFRSQDISIRKFIRLGARILSPLIQIIIPICIFLLIINILK